MIGSIFTALSGMVGHQRALNVISNNVTNMNSPGFRGSTMNFTDVLGPRTIVAGGGGNIGSGVDSSQVVRDTRTGERQLTGNEADLALDGAGYFVLQNQDGETFYTRNGRFAFNDEGELLSVGQGLRVMARGADGVLIPVTVADLRSKPPKATTEVTLDGFISSASEQTTLDVSVIDTLGATHTVKLTITRNTNNQPPLPEGQAAFTVKAAEGDADIGEGTLTFHGAVAIGSPLRLDLELSGTEVATVTFDYRLSQIVSAGSSSLRVSEQDGRTPGTITARDFDEKGRLKLTYSNGEKADGPTLALARIEDESGLLELGAALYSYRGDKSVTLREAGSDLKVVAKSLELSNVDLTTEFSQMILMQRGYQASSQVVSTANDMLQELLQMRGRG